MEHRSWKTLLGGENHKYLEAALIQRCCLQNSGWGPELKIDWFCLCPVFKFFWGWSLRCCKYFRKQKAPVKANICHKCQKWRCISYHPLYTRRWFDLCLCACTSFSDWGPPGMGTVSGFSCLAWNPKQIKGKIQGPVITSIEKRRLKNEGFHTCEGALWGESWAVVHHLRFSSHEVKSECFWSQKTWVYHHLLLLHSAIYQSCDLGN